MSPVDPSTSPSPLDDAVAALVDRYRAARPRSAEQLRRAAEVLPGGNTRSVLFHDPFPPTMVRGEGCRLWDLDDHRYLDALGEFTAGLYGHSDPAIRRAIGEALAGGLSLSSHTEREVALAEEMRRRFPSMALLRFTNSGTEANLMALATAKVHTGRQRVIVFDGAYHGGLWSFGGGASPTNVPHAALVAPYNDLDAVERLVAAHGHELAAIMVEPMLGAGGCIPGEADFLRGLRRLADGCGALLILDEVMTSRLGPGGRQAQLGLVPDLTVLGKYFGGGLSFGAFGGRSDVMQRYDPSRPDALAHAGTFNNNVLSMAAGLAGLTQVLHAPVLVALNDRGDGLRERLNALFARHGVDAQASGLGSLMNLHATAVPLRCAADLAASHAPLRALLYFGLLERGVYIARRGLIALSLPFGDAECDELVGALDDLLRHHAAVLPRVDR